MCKKYGLFKVILLVISVVLIIILLDACGFIGSDRSAERIGEDKLLWNGRTYVCCVGQYRSGNRVLAQTEDGLSVSSVSGDYKHNFVVVSSFIDSDLYVDEEYKIPSSGSITMVYWGYGRRITNGDFCKTVESLLTQAEPDYRYLTMEITEKTETQNMKYLFVAYEGCPVATSFCGCLGKINGTWYITTYMSPDRYNANGQRIRYLVECYTIPEEYWDVLEEYF